jgi:hypothetical protein
MAAKSLAEPLEAYRPQEGLKTKVPKHPEVLARAIRRTPQRGLHSRRENTGV